MKHIYLNLKRFDIPKEMGGVNRLVPVEQWAEHIVSSTQQQLMKYPKDSVEFAMFFPEAHLIPAAGACCPGSAVQIGCQGVFREDTSVGGGFGAFTTNRTANAARAMGCGCTLIGHCEERKDKAGILAAAGLTDSAAVNRLLNLEVKRAAEAGLKVLYCIGESAEEQGCWKEVLKEQLDLGLHGVDKKNIVLAYEPVWAIGPGKTPPDEAYITKIGEYIKEITGGMDLVYGGGLKADNAKMLSSIPVMDGGLIALTRFQGDIGFYPEEYLEIIKIYMGY